MELSSPGADAMAAGAAVLLPLFSTPIEGEPRQHPQWNGATVEVAGLAAGRLGLAKQPYVLLFGHDDPTGRLHRGDLILISQEQNDEAEIQAVRYRKKSHLVRRSDDGGWRGVSNTGKLPQNCPVIGHCVGIIWSDLTAPEH